MLTVCSAGWWDRLNNGCLPQWQSWLIIPPMLLGGFWLFSVVLVLCGLCCSSECRKTFRTTGEDVERGDGNQAQTQMQEVASQASTIVNEEAGGESADHQDTGDDIKAIPPWETTERVFYADASGYVLQGDPRYCLQCGLGPVPMGIYSKMLLPPGHHATTLDPSKHQIVH